MFERVKTMALSENFVLNMNSIWLAVETDVEILRNQTTEHNIVIFSYGVQYVAVLSA